MAFATDQDVENFHSFLEIYYQHSRICVGGQVVDWLAERGSDPDFWQCSVMEWNWDAGIEVLQWIARQPTCEMVTACWILVVGGSNGYLLDAPQEDAASDIYRDIADRLRAGFYRSDRLGLRGDNARRFEEAVRFFKKDLAAIGNPAIWALPDTAFGPFDGPEAIPAEDALFDDGQLRLTMDEFRRTYRGPLELPTWRHV